MLTHDLVRRAETAGSGADSRAELRTQPDPGDRDDFQTGPRLSVRERPRPELIRILKALANRSRLIIIDRLSLGECTAGELTLLVGFDKTTVSKHLAVLRQAGIVEGRRDGSWVVYKLIMPSVTRALGLVPPINPGNIPESAGPAIVSSWS